jgi:hypothetical protein
MNSDGILDYLRKAAGEMSHVERSLHYDGEMSSVRVWRAGSPDVWAEVASPGAMWARVSVDGGFMFVEADDTMDDDGLIAKIDECFAVAAAYLEDRPLPRGRFFPVITVETDVGSRELKRSLLSDIRHLIAREAVRGRRSQ